MKACQVRIVPVRVGAYDGDLRVHTSRIVGYRALCSCGARGPVRRDVRGARAGLAEVDHDDGET